ncbi:hypothetical protein PMG11_08746 [Penicillium brasilianum]|uniref:Uncharacterized protein n=1 Tax=Penicillium brasilianum TaxID=104259 RepID=A0A0F7TW85_PENBI|nr:hypothetical protein PMG11_08746 [Penicillium brasilianum]
MKFHSGPSDFDARLLRRLVGTKVITFCDLNPLQQPSTEFCLPSAIPLSAGPPRGISPPAASPTTNSLAPASLTTASSVTTPTISFSYSLPLRIKRSWNITEKLGETALHLSQDEVDMGIGPPQTVGKFLCHLEDDPTQIALMRIYYQIPITGTEDANLDTLAQQIQPNQVCGELEAFRQLMSQGCSSVPRLLGYCKRTQGEHELVPGGFAKYLVWEKVPGEPLTEESFWSLDTRVREDIRAKFRVAFEEMLRCGVKPQQPGISKIIYDQPTGNVRISRLRRGWPIREKLEWRDTFYVTYTLAKRPDERDWRSHPDKWEL